MGIKKILCLLTAMVLAPATVFAGSTKYQTEAINNVYVGDVNIELQEFTLDDAGEEIPMPFKSIVIPGDDLPQIVRIKNVAKDAWVRIKLEFQSDDELKGLDDSLVTFASDEWIKIGNYYYATKPIQSGTSVDFMKSIHIPEYWTEAYAEKTFRIVVTADAVQRKNFTPDFDSNDPWFGTIIEQCVHDVYEVPVGGNRSFLIEFRGGAEGFVRVGKDFFSNWDELMPGDVESGKVKIRNSYSSDIKLYFKTENLKGAELLKQLDLTIKATDGTIIYDGKMDKPLTKGIMIGEYPVGTEGYLSYTLHIPAELTNQYAVTSSRVKWIFETKISDHKPDSPKKTEGEKDDGRHHIDDADEPGGTKPAKTSGGRSDGDIIDGGGHSGGYTSGGGNYGGSAGGCYSGGTGGGYSSGGSGGGSSGGSDGGSSGGSYGGSGGGGTSGSGVKSANAGSGNDDNQKYMTSVRTGDDQPIALYIVLAACAVIILIKQKGVKPCRKE